MSQVTSERNAGAPMPTLPLSKPSLVRERYVLISTSDEDEKADLKSKPDVNVKASGPPRPLGSRISALRGVSTRGHKPATMTIRMVYDTGVLTSGAASAYSTVLAVKPSNCTEWASASTLFDECRCSKVDVFAMAGASTGGSSEVFSALPAWGIAWDPSVAAAYSGLSEILVAEHHHGPDSLIPPQQVSGAAATAFAPTPSFFGVRRFSVDLSPQTTVTPGTSTEIVGGGWFGTSDSGIIVGYLKPYVEVVGANNAVSNLRMWHVLTLHFRSRS